MQFSQLFGCTRTKNQCAIEAALHVLLNRNPLMIRTMNRNELRCISPYIEFWTTKRQTKR